MNPTELTNAIVATRHEMSHAMMRNTDNIYRRLPQAARDAWDALGLPTSLMVMLPMQILRTVAHKAAKMEAEEVSS